MTKKIRLYTIYGLIFFCMHTSISCTQRNQNESIRVRWKDKKAISILIPINLAGEIPENALAKTIQVRLRSSGNVVAIFGQIDRQDRDLIFTPLIPFTRGLRYEVLAGTRRIGTFDIPNADAGDAPDLLAIFPSSDSLPENLLKIYLRFSQPMQEGQSAKYVTLVRNENDTIRGAFLDLQPELWNDDRTMLTLWLDPGRIKRDLKPNKLLGAPLQANSRYQISVSQNWKDQQGSKLKKAFTKNFVTTVRDSISPAPKSWKITRPRSGSTPLKIAFGESLDYGLLVETMSVVTHDGPIVPGKWQIEDKESTLFFTPDKPWISGTYKLIIETRLEDLAGNNLNRPFDRDVTDKNLKVGTTRFVDIPFRISD
jgi:hypothetical protein